MSNRDRTFNPDKGKNYGQGLAGISDEDRGNLVNEDPVRNDHIHQRAGDSRPEGENDRRQSSSSDQRR